MEKTKDMKIIIDEKKIDRFLDRGVEAVYPTRDALKKKLMSGERLKIYQGFDPTGPYLHVGHAMGIRAMKILQDLGHEVIFLVGDFTSRVGDPDKNSVRKMLSLEDIKKNMEGWKEQAAQMIDFGGDNPVKFLHNYNWLSKLTLDEIIKLMSHMTVQQMLERDMFERRLKEGDPIHVQEFIYPLMQGYDGVAMGVDIEMGGADQTFNMLVGRRLSKVYLNKEKFVRTNKMMDATDGRTMSKTKGNGINLGDTADEMYGKAMSYSDDKITMGLELLTSIPMDEVKKIGEDITNGKNQMNHKKMMSFEIVKAIKGKEVAQKAQTNWIAQFSKKEIPDNLKEFNFNNGIKILEVLKETKLSSSNSNGRRKIDEKAVQLDGKKLTDHNFELKKGEFILKLGKKMVKINVK